jgi:hypothetical protein
VICRLIIRLGTRHTRHQYWKSTARVNSEYESHASSYARIESDPVQQIGGSGNGDGFPPLDVIDPVPALDALALSHQTQ